MKKIIPKYIIITNKFTNNYKTYKILDENINNHLYYSFYLVMNGLLLCYKVFKSAWPNI